MAICDCNGNYILFRGDGNALTRVWNRDQASCVARTPTYYNKLKYYVLKNPKETTVKGTQQLVVCTNAKTVNVGNKRFAINGNIYDRVVELLSLNPTNSLDGLNRIIAQARSEIGVAPPISVQFKDIPLSNVLINRTYSSIGDKWKESKVVGRNQRGSIFKFGVKVSSLFNTYKDVLPYINFWSGKFNTRDLNLKEAQYFYAQNDEDCGYTSSYLALHTTAVRAGATIIPLSALRQFRETGIINFDPFPASSKSLSLTLAFVIPDYSNVKVGVFPAKFGAIFIASSYWVDTIPNVSVSGSTLQTLIRNEIKKNSELIFIPILSELDIIENLQITPGAGCYFPVTNGGDISLNISVLFNQLKNDFADTLTLQNRDYSFKVNL